MGHKTGRVIWLTNFLPPYRVHLARELQKIVDLKILVSTAMEGNRSWNADWQGLDVSVQRTLTLQQTWRHPTGFSERGFLHLPLDTIRQVREFAPDVILSSEFGPRSLGAYFAAKGRGIPLIIWATLSDHTEKGRGFIRCTLRRFILSGTAAVLVNGEAGQRYLRKLQYPEHRTFTVHTAIQTTPFLKVADIAPASTRRILLVGSLEVRKGLVPFVEAAGRWCGRNPQQGIELRFAGAGSLKAELDRIALPENMRLTFLGELAYEDIPSAYASADLLAFPTLADEWGQVVGEALASGRPVLGSLYSQAVEELVVEGKNGWVFHPERPGEVDAALQRVMDTSRQDLHRMGKTARRAAEEIGVEQAGQQIGRVVTWCLSGS